MTEETTLNKDGATIGSNQAEKPTVYTSKYDGTFTTTTPLSIYPIPKWKWNVFGGNPALLEVRPYSDVPLWRRILTRVFLGSKWERLKP